jgi:PAS domain S-box-containing protein
MKNLFFAMVFLLVLSCEDKTKKGNELQMYKSFKDIPGLTNEEIAAIEALQKEHSTFKYAMTLSTEAFLTKDGEVGGFSSLLCQWLTDLLGIPFKPEIYERNNLLHGLESKEIDFTGDLTISDERKKKYLMTGTIAERSLKAFKIEDAPSIADVAKSRLPRLAFMQGFASFDNVKRVMDNAFEPIFVDNYEEAYKAIKSGDADAFLTMNITKPNFDIYSDVVFETFYPLVFASAALSTQNQSLKPIISVVQKALEKGGISFLAKMYAFGNRDYIKNKFFERLTHEELEHIQNNPVVKIATETDYYPISFYSKNDRELQGIAFDVMKEIELITGLSFEVANTLEANIRDLTDMVESGKVSMFTVVMRSKEREKQFLLPKATIMKDNSILISKSEFPNIQFSELSNVTVGIVKGTMMAELFKQWFPNNMNFKEYNSMNGVFDALDRGEVDMIMSMSNYLLSIGNYKEIAGYKANVVFNNNFDITFGFNKNETVLHSIIDKALALIDIEPISGYWVHKTYDYRAKVAEERLPWLVGAVILSLAVLALALILLYRSRIYRKRLAKSEALVMAKEADERTKIMLDSTPLSCTLIDSGYNIIDCNKEAERLFGLLSKQEYISRFFDFTPEYQPDGQKSREKAYGIFKKVFDDGYANVEWQHLINEEIVPCEVILVRVKYYDEYIIAGYTHDLRKLKEADAKIKEADERTRLMKAVAEKNSILSAILDATPDLIFFKDSNLRHTECNKSLESHLNIRKDDIIGKNDAEAFNFPLDLVEHYAAKDKKVIAEKQVSIVEEIIPSAEGKELLFETIKSPIIHEGEAIGLVGISRDITQRNKMINDLEHALADADAANRAKSSFLATMSHEIRTPMNAILGITEIQLQSKDLPAESKNALNIIYNSGYTLLGIINDLLDLSKIEAGKFELINMRYETASLINDTINLNLARIGSKPIEFKLHVSEDLPFDLVGDELRVKQILNNLLSNAFKYTDEGEVSLAFSAIASDKNNSDVEMEITVRDTGHGMTEKQVQNLFDAYSRFDMKANRYVEGTGLGMNIVQNLVKKIGGDIFVNSELGKGTEITVHLKQSYASPAKLGKELAESLMAFRLESMSKINKAQIVREPMPYGRVLVVDDMETNLYVAKGFLLPYGLEIDTALSGKRAIEKIEHGNVYDIVFMDHMMPEMDGIEAVKIIRSKGYTNPIVAFTANAVAGQAEIFIANGFDGFISKPIDIREMNASLNKFVRDKQLQVNPELAKIFVRDAEKAIAVLQSYENENLQMYIISVHALKSALANIGETKLSDFARELEAAGKNKNTAFISEKTKNFLEELRVVVGKLKSISGKHGTGEILNEDMEHLRKTLLLIKDACAAYNVNEATVALKELKQKPWPSPYGELIDTISEHLLRSDFDEAGEACVI